MFETICANAHWCPRGVLEATLELAVEIAREGREGRRIGTIFTLGRADTVLGCSRPLILDPIALHPREVRNIADANLRGTVKELAQLDGAFVLDEEGIVMAGVRYLNISAYDVKITFGLGSRHLAAASVTKMTGCIAIVVSESAVVRVFYEGELRAEILPELWLMSRHTLQLQGRVQEERMHDLAIVTSAEPARETTL
jgi:DNA integrity scanning protein DisA with diadenylate cyclase activity